jgi:hypothetical protein
VFDFVSLSSLVIPAAAVVATLVGVRRLAGDQPADLAVLFGQAAPMSWPRGVQEEEPQPWRFDILDHRSAVEEPSGDRGRATDTGTAPRRAAAGCATC